MTTPQKPLIANHDFNRYVFIEYVASTGVVTPLTSATVTGFFATTNGPNATTADANLSASLTHVGGANGIASGTWLWQLDAATLTDELLDPLFAGQGFAYFIVTSTNNIRRYEKVPYFSQYPFDTP